MDFLTHTLTATGLTRLICPRTEWRPQLSLAAILAALLPDADSWLYHLGPNVYGQYHRVVSHTIWSLPLIGLLSAIIAWLIATIKPWRRFGWFVLDNLPPDNTEIPKARFLWFLAAAQIAVALHWCGDVITGFGNVLPFWPWSRWDASLHAVSSFEWPIFALTLSWHIAIRRLDRPRKREAWITGLYFLLIILYILARLTWGEKTVW